MARAATGGQSGRRLVAKPTDVTAMLPDGKIAASTTAVQDIKTFRGIYRFLKRQAGAFQPVNKTKGEQTNG